MNLDPMSLLIGLLLSSIGLGFFVFGKKQHRGVPLGAGALLMAVPFLPVCWWIEAVIGAVVVAAAWALARAGW